MSDYTASLIRTMAAWVAGWLISLPILANLPEGMSQAYVQAAVVSLMTAVYYRVVRQLEKTRGSSWGWLLLRPGDPVNPVAQGVIRTVAPQVVAELVVLAHPLGLPDDKLTTFLGMAVPFVMAAVYYAAVRALERYVPGAGVLLLWIGEPSYQSAQASTQGRHAL